jgi:hypothetical protein
MKRERLDSRSHGNGNDEADGQEIDTVDDGQNDGEAVAQEEDRRQGKDGQEVGEAVAQEEDRRQSALGQEVGQAVAQEEDRRQGALGEEVVQAVAQAEDDDKAGDRNHDVLTTPRRLVRPRGGPLNPTRKADPSADTDPEGSAYCLRSFASALHSPKIRVH